MALAFAIDDAGGQVIGPAASIEAALALLEKNPVAGAILDVNLVDGNISPVVEYLMERNVPLVIQTGVGLPADLAARFPHLVVFIKPNVAEDLVEKLAEMVVERQAHLGNSLENPAPSKLIQRQVM